MTYKRIDLNALLGKNWCCFTSNEGLKASGENVMGRGTAAVVKAKWPDVPARYGEFLQRGDRGLFIMDDIKLIAFPVKPTTVLVKPDKSNIVAHMRHRVQPNTRQQGWMALGYPELIRKSWCQLVTAIKNGQFGDEMIYLPNPGTGNAGVDPAIITQILDSNPTGQVTIIHL